MIPTLMTEQLTEQPAGKPYYITTAIAYPNGAPHIGHAYEAIATDAIARFMRLDGGRGELTRLVRLAEVSERINAAARDAEMYNLERKPLVFSVFGLLAEATHG